MDVWADITSLGVPSGTELMLVVGGALLLALLERLPHMGRAPRYDAWWLFNVSATQEKKVMREFSNRERRRRRRAAAGFETPAPAKRGAAPSARSA